MKKLIVVIVVSLFFSCKTKNEDQKSSLLIKELFDSLSVENNIESNILGSNVQFNIDDKNNIIGIQIDNTSIEKTIYVINKFDFLKEVTFNKCKLLNLNSLKSNTISNINLDYNDFEYFPNIKNLYNLGSISLRFNKLKGIVKVGTHSNIGYLDLSNNEIDNIIFINPNQFNNLRDINLSKNKICKLDSSFYMLPNLKSLSLYCNEGLSLDLSKFNNLEVLEVDSKYKFKDDDISFIRKKNIMIIRVDDNCKNFKI